MDDLPTARGSLGSSAFPASDQPFQPHLRAKKTSTVPLIALGDGMISLGVCFLHKTPYYQSISCTADRQFTSPREDLPLPTQPPYTVFVGNLTFDITESELEAFFSPHQVCHLFDNQEADLTLHRSSPSRSSRIVMTNPRALAISNLPI